MSLAPSRSSFSTLGAKTLKTQKLIEKKLTIFLKYVPGNLCNQALHVMTEHFSLAISRNA